MRGVRRRLHAALAPQRALLTTRAGRLVALAVGAFALATLVALVALWPGPVTPTGQGPVVASRDIVPATVQGVIAEHCPLESRPGCVTVAFRLDGGLRAGRTGTLSLPGDEASPRLVPGDCIRVTPTAEGFGGVSAEALAGSDPSQAAYSFVDFERRRPLLVLACAFAVLVVLLGRRVGLASLAGAALGLGLLSVFVVPAILNGAPPLLVALVASFAAMFATIVLIYGVGAKSLAALLGTGVSLLVIGLLALVFVRAAHITGTSSEDATLILSLGGGHLSLQGLVLAGMVIGALGVLSDVSISQASTVLALRRAAPAQSLRQLYAAGVGVGRDHLGATVNTLVFAYAGASLPLLLIFSTQGVGFSDAVNRETVATEVVAALVGSIGLILAVPLTTLTASLLAVRLPSAALPADDGGHGHAH